MEYPEITNNSIKIIWTSNTEPDLDGYNIYRYTIASPAGWGDLIGTVSAGNKSYVDEGLGESITYYYVITAFDEVPNESNSSAVVSGTTKQTKYKPEINNSVKDFSIDEDTNDNSTINLYYWFNDLNSEPLFFWSEGQENINVIIFQNNGTVVIRPLNDWYGSETILFYASDGMFNISDDVKITVNPINDPPDVPRIIEPNDLTEIYYGTPLNFTGECNDSDLPEDELSYKWTSSLQGDFGSEDTLVDIILVSGTHQITLIVTDRLNESASVNVTVKVLENFPSKKSNEINIYSVMGIVGLIVFVLMILLFFTLVHRKNREKKERTKTNGQTTSRFSFLTLRVPDTSSSKSDSENSKSSIEGVIKKE
jgi:hypothetical protein